MNFLEKGKWKYIPIEKRYFDDKGFDGFGSMQVLTDYVFKSDNTTEKKSSMSSDNKVEEKDIKSNKDYAKKSTNTRKSIRKEKGGCSKRKSKKNLPNTTDIKNPKHDVKNNVQIKDNNDVEREKKKPEKLAVKMETKTKLIAVKKSKLTTKLTNKGSEKTDSQKDLDPDTIKANRLERKKIKRKVKKATAMARKKEAAELGIDLKELKASTEKTIQQTEKKAKTGKPSAKQQKINKKLARQNKRQTIQSSIIDITDIDKHVDADTLKEADKSLTKKRKIEDYVDEKDKRKKLKKKNNKSKNVESVEPKLQEANVAPKTKAVDMAKWKDLFVPDVVLKALAEIGFDAPTPIQCLTLPSAIRDRQDILGAAETGSGKTLAFGIPVIHNILKYKQSHQHGASDSASDDESEDDLDSGGEEILEGSGGEEILEGSGGEEILEGSGGEEILEGSDDGWAHGPGHFDTDSEDDDDDEDDDGIWNDEESDESKAGDGESGEEADNRDENEEEASGAMNQLDDFVETDNQSGDEDEQLERETSLLEESDDSGEYDLAPEEDEEYFELKDGEFGCLAAVNNVSFDWMVEEGMETVGPEDIPSLPEPQISRKTNPDIPLHCLVLTPTRELAIQIQNHLQTACKHTDIKICCVVGGMAAQKQERILRKCPEIVIATPGRFWELLQQGEPHLAKVTRLRALVIDEADRMVEKGHFEEMKNFMEFLKENEVNSCKRQNFVFSATLTMVHKAPSRLVLKKKKVKQQTTDDKLESLVEMIGVDPKAKVIDLSRKLGTAEGLVESRINCTAEEKDIYLYYFLQRYPGRTLVFSNSKDCLRRLVSIFTLLKCNPLPLHADMQQRQRLKNLDKFKADSKGLLLATDVAARGLDIPNVEHVIHYQVPRTSENYVHRSGRTARASKEGLSVVLIGQDDMTNYRKIMRTLNRSEDLGVFPVEEEYMVTMRQRMGLARKIDKAEHINIKSKKQNMWFEKAAREMDIVLDEEGLLNDLGDSQQQAKQKQRLSNMRRELTFMLSQPVIPRVFSGRYPTKMGKLDLPLNTNSKPGDACAAVRKETQSNTRFNIGKMTAASLKTKKGNKKKFKRRK